MKSNVDVLNELQNKNKEIYLNKLIVDIENNSEILEININNVLDMLTIEVISKVREIYNNIDCSDKENEIKTFQSKIKDELIKLVEKRKDNLKKNITIEEGFNYKGKLLEETTLIISSISTFYQNKIHKLIKNLEINLDCFGKERLNDYFQTLYFERLITKLQDILNNKDLILCNNYQAGLLKYQNMNEKALNLV